MGAEFTLERRTFFVPDVGRASARHGSFSATIHGVRHGAAVPTQTCVVRTISKCSCRVEPRSAELRSSARPVVPAKQLLGAMGKGTRAAEEDGLKPVLHGVVNSHSSASVVRARCGSGFSPTRLARG